MVLFTSDRGITPADAARAAEAAGFDAFYVPEHSHIPTSRDSAHPGTGGEIPDDRYLRILDPWVALATAAAVTSTIRLGTAVALPMEHDPITLAKTIATLDHLSGGRVTLGVGFGWNVEELEDHGVPAKRRRTVLREYLELMRSLWTDEVAAYDGEFASLKPSWAWPKPVQAHVPVLVGAGGTPKNFAWIVVARRRLDHHPDRDRHRAAGGRRCTPPGRRRAATARRGWWCWWPAGSSPVSSSAGPRPVSTRSCSGCPTRSPRRSSASSPAWARSCGRSAGFCFSPVEEGRALLSAG